MEGGWQMEKMSGERPQIGILVDDAKLRHWLSRVLPSVFSLVQGAPDSAELATACVYILDALAMQRHQAWLHTYRTALQPDSAPILLLFRDAEPPESSLASQADALLSIDLTGDEFREQLMHWVRLQASARLWELAASGASGQFSSKSLSPSVQPASSVNVAAGNPFGELGAKLYHELVSASSQGMFICDLQGLICMVNPAFCALSGYCADELVGRPASAFLPLFAQGDLYADFPQRVRQWGEWNGELSGRTKEGELFPFWLTVHHVPDDQPALTPKRPGFYIGIVTDLRTTRQLEESVIQLSRTGSLSELNRILVEERLTLDIRQAESARQKVAVLHIDLRRFRALNEQFGYAIGDWVLMSQLQRLQDLVGVRGLVSRLEANHYAVILPRLDELDGVFELAQQIIDQLSLPLLHDSKEIICPPVIGMSDYPEQGTTALELMRNADAAVDWCRKNGHVYAKRFSPELATWLQQQTDTEQALAYALKHEEFFLEYQPQINMRSGQVIGVEALIRWRSLEQVIPPKEFIPLAEESGLILPISDWVLMTACQQAATWLAQGMELNMAVNISATHFQHGLLVEQVEHCLKVTGLPAERLELEVTESCIMTDVELAISTLNRLKKLGVRLSVDDFGTGYSSLSYLKLFPLDKLKIDQSFVADLLNSNSDAVIVRSIIALGHAMGLTVIAEGVENQEQNVYLHLLHCDEVQGFLLGRPMAASQLPAAVAAMAAMAASGVRLTRSDESKPQTLLLVDDELSILNALRRTLRGGRYNLFMATSAEEAFDFLAHHAVGVIVSDNRMPGVTGIELLRQVKARYPQTVRIMLSGYADLEALSAAVNAGEIFRFISKPWDDDELKIAINDAFDKYDEQSALNRGAF
jgi:diguanylate cyclase (GGDEF)-like protein/PAS domain S-box-containing protein